MTGVRRVGFRCPQERRKLAELCGCVLFCLTSFFDYGGNNSQSAFALPVDTKICSSGVFNMIRWPLWRQLIGKK